MSVLKKAEPIIIDDTLLRKIYKKLNLYILKNKQKYVQTNIDLGSYHDADDYTQDTFICLCKKLKDKEIVFYSEQQLWTYCFRITSMLMLRQHRDYAHVSSRKRGTVINIDYLGEESLDDLIKNSPATQKENPDNHNENFYKDYFICIETENCSIVPVTQLFSVNSETTKIINLYSFINNINNTTLTKTLKLFNIKTKEKTCLLNCLKDFLILQKQEKINHKNCLYSVNSLLNNRDKELYRELKNNKVKKISFNHFKNLVGFNVL